jgi:hypothetical protein
MRLSHILITMFFLKLGFGVGNAVAQGNPCLCYWSLIDGTVGCYQAGNCGASQEPACSTHVNNLGTPAHFIGFDNKNNVVPGDWSGDACDFLELLLLPVELIEFKAKSVGDNVLLEWSTASERNNQFFRAFYSTNGADWEIVGDLPGAGNSSQELHYQLIHKNAPHGIVYYQLKQQDYDGTREFFPIISVDRTNLEKELVGIYDLLGRKVNSNHTGILIYRYSDGSSIKIYNE